jgi:hypothetical protein
LSATDPTQKAPAYARAHSTGRASTGDASLAGVKVINDDATSVDRTRQPWLLGWERALRLRHCE